MGMSPFDIAFLRKNDKVNRRIQFQQKNTANWRRSPKPFDDLNQLILYWDFFSKNKPLPNCYKTMLDSL